MIKSEMAEEDANGVREPLSLCGVEVDFPFPPYPCQVVYMENVIETLQRVRSTLHFDLYKHMPTCMVGLHVRWW